MTPECFRNVTNFLIFLYILMSQYFIYYLYCSPNPQQPCPLVRSCDAPLCFLSSYIYQQRYYIPLLHPVAGRDCAQLGNDRHNNSGIERPSMRRRCDRGRHPSFATPAYQLSAPFQNSSVCGRLFPLAVAMLLNLSIHPEFSRI